MKAIVGPFTRGDVGRRYYGIYDANDKKVAEFEGGILDHQQQQLIDLLNAGWRQIGVDVSASSYPPKLADLLAAGITSENEHELIDPGERGNERIDADADDDSSFPHHI